MRRQGSEPNGGHSRSATSHPLHVLLHVPVPWVFVLTYLVGAGVERAWPLDSAVKTLRGLTVIGIAVFGLGAAIAGWGLWTFRKARTTTVPGEASSQLVAWGPYRFSRNPMYVGLTLAYLGEAGILRQIWPVLLLPLVIGYVNGIVIPVEEDKLREGFGGAYDRYRSSVRRWI
jgi:protein-S-isoprenylcysteine O-methyltransferase Ste14